MESHSFVSVDSKRVTGTVVKELRRWGDEEGDAVEWHGEVLTQSSQRAQRSGGEESGKPRVMFCEANMPDGSMVFTDCQLK